ncbi:MAG: RluA family pseudouridine synthase, partial [Cyanobium sp.]
DRLAWHRPPWREEAVPAAWGVVHDDGDLLVLDKPAGLPVLPAGGFLEHTVLRLLERRHRHDSAGVPRPVHRLGRFTTGLLVCARRPASRAWLSALLRESTAALGGCAKVYRALLEPGALPLAPGESLRFVGAIGRRPHPRLGWIWCAASAVEVEAPGHRPPHPSADLPACSTLTLLERHPAADLVAVAIASGRPHQIRIHCAALGAPLLGDPLYDPGGGARPQALPGQGGYQLQAWRLELPQPDGGILRLEAPAPLALPKGP